MNLHEAIVVDILSPRVMDGDGVRRMNAHEQALYDVAMRKRVETARENIKAGESTWCINGAMARATPLPSDRTTDRV